ncbi:hypothetical protein RIR_jg12100.t1 [Rhizophagus irregularis DAOM 181602=DAOM 197198]|nr:hypothetical protein RIR_jg12100.t1 [Rhizophagus irregularis DAOM 181602=DAOM 197198]
MNQTEVTIKLSIPSIATAEATEKPGESGGCTIISDWKLNIYVLLNNHLSILNALNLKYNKTKTVLEHVVLNYVPYLSVFYRLCILKIKKIKSHL